MINKKIIKNNKINKISEAQHLRHNKYKNKKL